MTLSTLEEQPELPETPVILAAEDLSPSDIAKLDPAEVLGLCTVTDGPTFHTAIIARSLDIPTIVGTGLVLLHQTEGAECILNGEGSVAGDPGPVSPERR